MFRKIAISALGAAMLVTSPLSALAMPMGNGLPVVKTDSVQLIDHRRSRRFRHYRYRNHGYQGRHYRHYRRHRHHNDGAAIVAGIIGLGAALAIANSNRRHSYYNGRYYDDRYYDDRYYGSAPAYGYRSGSADWIAACARKYRSFEPHTGLYTTYSGYKRRCRLP